MRVSPLYEHDLADLWIFLTHSWMLSQPNSTKRSHLPFALLHERKGRIAKMSQELGAVGALMFYFTKLHEMKGSSLVPGF